MEVSHNRGQGDDFIDTLHYPTPTVTISHGHNEVLCFGSQPLMNPVRHSIHSLPVYAVRVLPMYLTSPPESIYSTSEGISGVVLFRKVGSALDASKTQNPVVVEYQALAVGDKLFGLSVQVLL